MDIVEMPQEDYSQDKEVRGFEKEHRAEGVGLKMENLEYTYHNGTNVFEHATVEAYPHEIVALVGPSGEGKTTMLRLILSLRRKEKPGSVRERTGIRKWRCRRRPDACSHMCHRAIRCSLVRSQRICGM